MTINAGSWSEGFYEGGLKKELYIVEKNWYQVGNGERLQWTKPCDDPFVLEISGVC